MFYRFALFALRALLTLAVIYAMGLGSSIAEERTFGPFHYDPVLSDIIRLEGPIESSTALDFRRALLAAPSAKTLMLNSPGGLVTMALLIADDVHQRGFATVVPNGSVCLSACSFIFFGGVTRSAVGALGVHQISSDTADLTEAQITISDIIDMLNRFGTPADVLTIMFRTPAKEIHVFTDAEVAQFGINKNGLRSEGSGPTAAAPPTLQNSPPPSLATQIVPAPQQVKSLPPSQPIAAPTLTEEEARQRQCQAFADRYYAAWSGDNVTAMSGMEESYADALSFYDKRVSKAQVIEEKRKFVNRWPERRYSVRGGTYSVTLQPDGCEVTGVVDWSAHSDVLKKSPHGSAQFKLGLAGQTTLHIVAESATKSELQATIAPASPAPKFGDFPLASCKGWNGTVRGISGTDTANARMVGEITEADLREYCERDPGGETVQFGGHETVQQCIEHNAPGALGARLVALADCGSRLVSYRYGSSSPATAQFPIEDSSCASGNPPMIEQFRLLCPRTAKFTRFEASE